MNEQVVKIELRSVTPTTDALMRSQNIPNEAGKQARTTQLVDTAISTFTRLASPVGLISEITVEDFRHLYRGEGDNQPDSVVQDLLSRTTNVTLFVATVGEELSGEIGRLFSVGEFPLASMLDSAASEGADMAADVLEKTVADQYRSRNVISDGEAVLRFSPGYCGWHINGQRALLEKARPEQIGVTLSDSCLMSPLKSVSGVIMSAPIAAFDINDNYQFCADCRNRTCRDRYRKLVEQSQR